MAETGEADIGLVGLGTMGSAFALNLAEKGFRVAIWNLEADRTQRFLDEAGELAARFIASGTLDGLVASIRPPRPIIMLIPSGAPVDQMIAAFRPLLGAGDMLIDAGNADFRETLRRIVEFADHEATFLGMGVSGGAEGARHGPSIMAGADPASWERLAPFLTAVAARYEGEPCAARVGPGAAGHFVKTVHNGIEYAEMQMIAEIYGVMRDGLGLAPSRMSEIFARWNEGPLSSYLVEITAAIQATHEPDGTPFLDLIVDSAGQKGTGRWAAIEAQHMGVPASTIEAAVTARVLSSLREERAAAARIFASTQAPESTSGEAEIVAELEQALLAGRIVAYAQGFAIMQAASGEFGWDMDLAAIARIWRAGCIIRSRLLDDIMIAFAADPLPANLAVAPEIAPRLNAASGALRVSVARAVLQGLPMPALAAALAWYDTYRQPRGTADLIQAQRDYFGQHGFEQTGREGVQHGPWATRS